MILAVDIGGTKIAAALVSGGDIVEYRTMPSPMHIDHKQLPEAVADLCGDWMTRCEAIGIATAGLIENNMVRLVSARGRPVIPLAEEIQARCGKRPVILNDAWAGALGEYIKGDFGDVETLVYVTVSTGIGAGIIHKGQLLTSRHGLLAWLGHMTIDPGPERAIACNCGRYNCVELFASGSALARRGSALLGRLVSARDVFQLEKSDQRICQMLDDAARVLAGALVNARALCGADVFVIGGSVGLVPSFFARLQCDLASHAEPWAVSIRPAAMGANAELFGAAEIARRSLAQGQSAQSVYVKGREE